MLTNRHMFVLASLAATPETARLWQGRVEDLVRQGLAEWCGVALEARPTEAGVARLAKWVGRPAFAEDEVSFTPREIEALRLIAGAIERTGASPSQAELASGLRLRSRGAVQPLLRRLEAQGAIRRGRGRGSIEVLKSAGANDVREARP